MQENQDSLSDEEVVRLSLFCALRTNRPPRQTSLEEILRLNRHNARFEQPNLEEELVLTYYRRPVPGEFGSVVSVANILERINSAIKQPLSSIKVSMIMRELGFEPIRNKKQRGFRVAERTQDEIRVSRQAIARYTMDCSHPDNDREEPEPELVF